MVEQPDVRNEAAGMVTGAVVQAGSIDWVSLAGTPLPERPPVPRQLPLAVRDFTGRVEHLAALDALLPTHNNVDAGVVGAVVISALDGTAGVGKTTLAVHWAHRVQHQFLDGTLHANLRGYGPGEPATPNEVLEGFLRALGTPPERIPIGLDAQTGLYRSLLTGRRVLIVLDNANAAEQVRPLLPGSPGCLVLVTSRATLTGLVVSEAASRLTLDLLTPAESLELVRGLLGEQRVAAEPEAVTELIRACARLPLALRITAAHAATHPHRAIAKLVADMREDRTRLDTLSPSSDATTSVRAVFDWSYRRLTPDQARLFRRLGLHPGPEISLHAAAAVAGLELAEARRLLDQLAEAHLIEAVAEDRYRLHDLLRAYAADHADTDDPHDDREQARRRLLEWYAHHTTAAHQILFPAHADWHPLLSLDTHAHPPIAFAGHVEAWTWLDAERANLIAATHHAAQHHFDQLTILVAYTHSMALFRRGMWNDMFDINTLGLAATRRNGDRLAETHALLHLSETHGAMGQWAEASAADQGALALARTLHDPWLEACAFNNLGFGCLRQERYGEAIDYLRQALPLSPGAQRGRLQAIIEANLSVAHTGLGHHEQALTHAERALPLYQHTGERGGEAYALHHMARAHQGMGHHAETITLCEHALSIGRDHGHPTNNADALDALGRSLHHVGDIARALTCWREALTIYDDFADPRAARVREHLQALHTPDPGPTAST